MSELNWKIGFEIELMAPKGLSRKDLAEAIALQYHGFVHRIFYPQSEPSHVPGTPLFHNLTLGFEVIDPQGNLIVRCVDDLTLQNDLDKTQQSQSEWYRIVSDDTRLLHLVMCQADPQAASTEVLKPIADLFATELEVGPGGMVRVADHTGNPIAIAALLPGERERPCELITPPIDHNHFQCLQLLLDKARALGFTIPYEGATHFHFDATKLCSPQVFANLVNILWTYGEILKKLVGTNPHCTRLGSWDEELLILVNDPDFCEMSWFDVQEYLGKLELTKYCDFNLKNLIHPIPDKFTFEARIFPAWLDPEPVIASAALMEAILNYAVSAPKIAPVAPWAWKLETVVDFLNILPISQDFRQIWLSIAASVV
ncbi:amidoligase family protein [Fortiea contorta]|uniref:amidoligase family protein n=1 Tax=Fortiea contorta TaxID=1892405 RepID=UPI000374B03D|nr:amidoligase family protein [Fortiea contorta]